jgi:hypothetical protein
LVISRGAGQGGKGRSAGNEETIATQRSQVRGIAEREKQKSTTKTL